jgi:hypothetical protein
MGLGWFGARHGSEANLAVLLGRLRGRFLPSNLPHQPSRGPRCFRSSQLIFRASPASAMIAPTF